MIRKGYPPRVRKKLKYKRKNKLRSDATYWDSIHKWEPLLEHNYSKFFDHACNTYSHYLDTVIHGLEVIKVGEIPETEEDDNTDNDIISVFKKPWLKCAFIALDDDFLDQMGIMVVQMVYP